MNVNGKSVYEVIVVGGGPAGLAAALSAAETGARVLLLERHNGLGGILNQCIHNGFGLHVFKEELTGPEYAGRFIEKIKTLNRPPVIITGATVLAVSALNGKITVNFVHREIGCISVTGKAVVLAMGCRERTRGAIGIPGTRPSGIFSAGTAQLYMNIEGKTVGKRIVILGSGDIGLIMARRLTLEGAKVLGVFELLPYSGGLTRNIVQCLDDYGIPLRLSHTITEIRGDRRVERVIIKRVNESRVPIAGTETVIDCDTVLLSVGLIPENELSSGAGVALDPRTHGPVLFENRETSVPGIFACGNVAHVHDLVDFVSDEAAQAGRSAALFALSGTEKNTACLNVRPGEGIAYAVPQKIRPARIEKNAAIFFRTTAPYGESKIEIRSGDEVLASFRRDYLVPGEMEKIVLPKTLIEKANGRDIALCVSGAAKRNFFSGTRDAADTKPGLPELVCIVCPKGCRLKVDPANGYAVYGNGCARGEKYGRQEAENPTRVVTSTVRISGAEIPRLPVKTDAPIPKAKITKAMKLLDGIDVRAPVTSGTVIAKNVCGSGANFIATRDL